jgi:transcriptional regulator with XRE-family HTH domain
MEIMAERLLGLRANLKLTQQKLSQLLSISQTAINRYEHGETAINANALLKYANFFDVSADYILGRCDDPQGKKYDYQPEYLKDKLANSKEWREFVEMCFDPNSPISSKLKETLFQMAGGERT